MPQQSMFGGWAVTDLKIHVRLEPSPKIGGSIEAQVLDENGKQSERFRVVWRRERDVTDLGHAVKAIVESFLWGEAGSVSSAVQTAPRAWLPVVPQQ